MLQLSDQVVMLAMDLVISIVVLISTTSRTMAWLTLTVNDGRMAIFLVV